jgi:predicted phage tail protein
MGSEERPAGTEIGEKFFGLMIIIVGFVLFYYSYTSYSTLSSVTPGLPIIVPGMFLCAGAAFLVGGVLLIIAKEKEE